MPDWNSLLKNLVTGDIFHASRSNGASYICIVESLTETTIQARTMTHQIKLKFDRRTGIADLKEGDTQCLIDAVVPLPVDVHNITLGLDRKMRMQPDPLKHKLTDEEKRALIFISDYYSSNLIECIMNTQYITP